MRFPTRFLLCHLLPKVIMFVANQIENVAEETKTPYDDLAVELAKVIAQYLPMIAGCSNADNSGGTA